VRHWFGRNAAAIRRAEGDEHMTGWHRVRVGFGLASLLLAWVLMPSQPRAASLTGDTITGTLNFCSLNGGGNAFSSDSGTAPMTFIHDEGIDGANTDTAAFDATTLTVRDVVSTDACGWGMQFTDTTTAFPSLTLISSNFSPELTYDLTNGAITISWEGTETPGTYTAVFNIDGDLAVPEPGTLATFGVGLTGIGFIRRRRSGSHDA
jgi:PEP-CTERM motif